MPIHRKFQPLPITAIVPGGWLSRYLGTQASGLTGHLQVAGFPFNTKGWACPKVIVRGKYAEPWWPYEQYAYWVDAMIRCGHLLGHKPLIAKAKRNIDYVLEHADADGYLGPKFLKQSKQQNRWPHAVFFRAMIAHYSATCDGRIITALKRHYLCDSSEHCLGRDVCNIEIMLWLYEKTQDKRLLDRALGAFEKYNRITAESGKAEPCQLSGGADTTLAGMLSSKPGQSHGVTYNEICKLTAIVYMYTGKKKYLAATANAYRKIDKFHMLIVASARNFSIVICGTGISFLMAEKIADAGLALWSTGNASGLLGVSIGIGGLLSGLFIHPKSEKPGIIISLAVGGPLLIIFPLLEGVALLVVLGVGAVVLASTIPLVVATGQRLLPHASALASSMLMGVAWGTSGVVAPIAVTWLGSSIGYSRAMPILAGAGLVVSLACTLALPRVMREAEDSQLVRAEPTV